MLVAVSSGFICLNQKLNLCAPRTMDFPFLVTTLELAVRVVKGTRPVWRFWVLADLQIFTRSEDH